MTKTDQKIWGGIVLIGLFFLGITAFIYESAYYEHGFRIVNSRVVENE